MLLFVGNPTNIIVAQAYRMSFIGYSKWMALPTLGRCARRTSPRPPYLSLPCTFSRGASPRARAAAAISLARFILCALMPDQRCARLG